MKNSKQISIAINSSLISESPLIYYDNDRLHIYCHVHSHNFPCKDDKCSYLREEQSWSVEDGTNK